MGRNLLFNFCTIPRVNDISKSSTTVLTYININNNTRGLRCYYDFVELQSMLLLLLLISDVLYSSAPHPRHNYIPFRNTFQSILYAVRTDGHKSLHLIILGAYNIFCVLGKWCFMNNIVHPEDSTICNAARTVLAGGQGAHKVVLNWFIARPVVWYLCNFLIAQPKRFML